MKNIYKNENSEAFNEIWGFTKHEKTKIILSTLKGESRGSFGYVASTNELLASSKIQSFLVSHKFPYVSSNIHIDKPFDYYKNTNLILIGGPSKNKITKKVIEEAESSLVYNFDYQLGLLKKMEIENPKIRSKDVAYVDRALIAKIPNPFNQKRVVLIIAGYRDIQTLFATDFLIKSRVINAIANSFNSKYFEIIIKIKIKIENNITDPYISIIYPETLKIRSFEIPYNEEAVYTKPIVNLFTTKVIPEKKIYLFLIFFIPAFFLNSLLLFFKGFSSIFLLPIFGSLSILFFLPLRIWEKYSVITINPTLALFGFCSSVIAFLTALGGIIIKLLLKI